MKPFYRINQRISASSVRLIDSDGTQLGIKSLQEALGMARTRGMDLIEIAPQANPPVCKILDFSKFRYEQEKKDREAHKKQKSGLLKEIRLRPNIATHDLETKVKHIEEFLKEHDKVRIAVVFRGRENQHKNLGFDLLKTLQARLNNVATVESSPSLEGNRIMMTLIPK
ncbi:MAG: translation initiation factor IF-3 [Elusimicrobia bacterium]|nr:translation initiation factor IF-3 [Elusimicrobiota bacterium]